MEFQYPTATRGRIYGPVGLRGIELARPVRRSELQSAPARAGIHSLPRAIPTIQLDSGLLAAGSLELQFADCPIRTAIQERVQFPGRIYLESLARLRGASFRHNRLRAAKPL